MFIRKALYIPIGIVLLVLAFAGFKVQAQTTPVASYYFEITRVKSITCNESYGLLVWEAHYSVPPMTELRLEQEVYANAEYLYSDYTVSNIYPDNNGYLDRTKNTMTGATYWTFPHADDDDFWVYTFSTKFTPYYRKYVANGQNIFVPLPLPKWDWRIQALCHHGDGGEDAIISYTYHYDPPFRP